MHPTDISCSSIAKVDETMAEIQEQTQLANEVSEAISANNYAGVEIDEVGMIALPCAFANASSPRMN